ncbi:putative transcriptional regulatory protein [Colletotrichum sp. SAR 10_77]|nr:putative transcriptional regulatory protein [Colletotrichum sp. SAR 10_75]KAI8256172.1 putative transcriptional regulatory protein [Colletotrichum sp. SAR 10_77]
MDVEKAGSIAHESIKEDVSQEQKGGVEHPMPEILRSLSAAEYRKTGRRATLKMDIIIMPTLMITFILNFLDRNNIAAAKLAGITEDLHLSETQYQTCVSVLFVGYIIMQIPSNMIIGKIKLPGVYICCAMSLWGIVTAAQTVVKSFASLAIARFAVGFVEAVFFSGGLFYLSLFFNRRQYALRAALFYSGSQLGNAFGGLLAIAILKLDGKYGLEGWRWLFLVEGVVTVGLALLFAFILPNSPDGIKSLSETERAWVKFNYEKDQGQSDDRSEVSARQGFMLAVRDPKTWLMLATLYCIFTSAGVTNFFPPVVATLGYSRTVTYALTAPPFILCCATMLANGFHSDRAGERYWHVVAPLGVTLAANVIAVSTLNVGARYTAMMLMPASFYAGSTVLLSWIAGTINQPVTKRAAAIALIVSMDRAASTRAPPLKIVPYQTPGQTAGQKRKRRGTHGDSQNGPSLKIRNACMTCRDETPDGPLQEDQYGHFHGGASDFAFLHMAKQKLARLPSMSIHFSDYPLAESGNLPPILPPKPIADRLMRTFFDFGLTTSRFVHEPTLMESFEKLYSDGQGDSLNNDSLALIYMVLTLGSHYSRVNNMYCGYSSSVRFYHMADRQLQRESSKITFASLQARLLATHYLLNHSRMHEAWSSFGIVVRHAQALGLHRRSVGPLSNYITHEYRKRLFWAIYVNDRIISSIFGRPCAIHDDDIDQDECALANDDDITAAGCRVSPYGEFCSAAALIHYARLSRILGKILRKFYSPAARNNSITQLHQFAAEFEKSLLDWQDNLPAYLNYVALPPSALSTMTQRQTCTLKLMFAHASLLLYRPFILYSMDPATGSVSRLEQWVKRCHDKSIEAARVVVNECRYLCQRGLFSRAFWLVNYMQFAALGTLYMYSHLWPEATHVRETAEEAMAEFPVGVQGDLVGQRQVVNIANMTEVLGYSAPDIHSKPVFSQEKSVVQDDEKLSLHGNGGVLDDVRLLQPVYPDTPIEEIQKRYWQDGVVWVKGLLDPDMVNKMRSDYLNFVDNGTGMLKPGTDPADGIFSGLDWREFLLPGAVRVACGLKDEGPFVDNAIASHSAAFYQDFKDKVGRELEPFVGKLAGFEESWCLPRSLLRCAVPGGETTPVHYDQIFLRAGPPTSVTAWVPIGDVELEGGGLIYLDRSAEIGKKYEQDFSRVNAELPDADRISAFNRNMEKGGWLDRNAKKFGEHWSRGWLVGAYEAGDVVFHTPYAVHAGAMNQSPKGRIRVSTDLRFVDKTKPYDERWTYIAYSENDPNVASRQPKKSD